MLMLWRLVGQGSEAVALPDMSSLDSITRGLPGGFYTTFRTYRSKTHVLGLRAHLDRLYRPAARLRVLPSVERPVFRRQIAALLASFPAEEARLRLILVTEDNSGILFVAMEPFQALPPDIYEHGVRVVTTYAHRDQPALKSTAFIGQSQTERRRLLEETAFEGLMVGNGRILEGLTSNFFYLAGGQLGTARSGVLNGVTRRRVLKLAGECGMEVRFVALPLAEISSIDESFLTSSSRGIVPIAMIDRTAVGSGGVGEGTLHLMRAYDEDVERHIEPIS